MLETGAIRVFLQDAVQRIMMGKYVYFTRWVWICRLTPC